MYLHIVSVLCKRKSFQINGVFFGSNDSTGTCEMIFLVVTFK